jgi:hypothetical protein
MARNKRNRGKKQVVEIVLPNGARITFPNIASSLPKICQEIVDKPPTFAFGVADGRVDVQADKMTDDDIDRVIAFALKDPEYAERLLRYILNGVRTQTGNYIHLAKQILNMSAAMDKFYKSIGYKPPEYNPPDPNAPKVGK